MVVAIVSLVFLSGIQLDDISLSYAVSIRNMAKVCVFECYFGKRTDLSAPISVIYPNLASNLG